MMLANEHFVRGVMGIGAEQQVASGLGFPWTAAGLQSDSSSGAASTLRYRGLGWDRKFGCWRVRIFYNGKQRHVGRFRDALTAARAYNKVVTFLYGDKAILNLLPPGDDDTFDIPCAIRQAKVEAQIVPFSATAPSSSNRGSSSSLTTSITSGDHLSFSSISNGSCSNMLQLTTAHQAELQLRDLLLPMGASSMLPLSCGLDLQNLSDSPLDSPLLCAGLPEDLAGIAPEPFLHPSTGFQAGIGPSTTTVQVPLSAPGACFLQDPCALPGMPSTQAILDASTQRLQLLELNSTLLSGGCNSLTTQTGLGAGLQQASTGLLGLQEPCPTVKPCQQPVLSTSVAGPASLGLASGTACAGTALGTPAQHVSTPGVVMGYPVLSQGLWHQRHVQAALPAQQLGAVGLADVSQPAQLPASNGMIVIFAPAPPA